MKKIMLYIAIGFVVLFIIQVFRNSPVTEMDDSKSPMYGFERDTTPIKEADPFLVADEGDPVANPMQAIKEQLFVYENLWFAKQQEYMVKEDDFVEPIIQQVLEEQNDGKLPKNSGGVEKIARYVIYAYRAKLEEPEGLKRTEQLVQKRYDNPVITVVRNGEYLIKTVDLGVLPTKLSAYARGGILQTRNSGVIDDKGRWMSEELIRQIEKHSDDNPNQIKFIVRFSPYFGDLITGFQYNYITKIPDSPFPPLINIKPENNYEQYKGHGVSQTLYLFLPIEKYKDGKKSVYDVNQYNYKQRPEWKASISQ